LKEVGRGGRREEKWRERKKKGGWRKEKGGLEEAGKQRLMLLLIPRLLQRNPKLI
jgi:hypothetical protein